MAKLEVSLFGQFQVLLNGSPVTQFESLKVRLLLAYLAAEADRAHSRENLAALLWPDWPQQSAMRNLRNALADLRQNLGDREAEASGLASFAGALARPPYLLVTRESLQLNREADLRVDVIEFEQGIRDNTEGIGGRGKGVPIKEPRSAIGDQEPSSTNLQSKISNLKSKIFNLKSTIALYRGPFLDGFPQTDNSQFEEWVLAKREYFSQQMLKALGRLAEGSLEQGEYEQAEGYARKQIELEPWRETSYQQLMRSLSLRGERVQALAQFESLRKALQRELSVEPSEDTLALYRQIRDGEMKGIRDKGTGEQGTAIREQEAQGREQRIAISDQRSEAISQQSKISNLQSTILNNLPLQLTSFIGREKEIEAVIRLLQTARLVTLTGPGGTGKTRLGLQVAAGLVDQYADGVWLVELAPVADPTLVPAIAARALGLRELPGPQAISLLQEFLGYRQLLLILDNCEHVIEACIRLADALLQTCPRLTILVSSREALGISGEVPFRVPPMSLPEMSQSPPIENLAQYEAIRLFVERAATVSPGFTLTPASAPAILQVCQRLDGIPLAIELAAARVRLLQVTDIAVRLDDRFRLLTGGSRAALPRYQALRASIDWSYELLSPSERALLQRLSVFASGWVLEAAEAVGCEDFPSPSGRGIKGEGIQSCDVLDLLGQLVDKSLIQTGNPVSGLYRFRMLETIRQYAHEKLVESGQAEAVRQRHLQYYLELAEKARWALRGPDQSRLLIVLGDEVDNLRLALAWSLEGRGRPGWDPEPGLRLAAALHWFWHPRGQHVEGIQWIERLLTAEGEDRGESPLSPSRCKSRAEALLVAGFYALMMGEHRLVTRYSEESLALFTQLGKDGRRGVAKALYNLGGVASHQGDLQEATRLMNESLAIARQEGDLFTQAEALMTMGMDAMNNRDYEGAKALYEDCLALRREMGDRDGEIVYFFFSGRLAFELGEDEQAREYFMESHRIANAIGSIWTTGFPLPYFGRLEWMQGKYEQAALYFNEILATGRRHGDIDSTFIGLISLGKLAMSRGDYLLARTMFSESLALCQKNDCQLLIAFSLYYLGILAWAEDNPVEADKYFHQVMENSQKNQEPYSEILAWFGLHRSALAEQDYDRAWTTFENLIALWQSRRTVSPPWSLPVYLEPFAYLEAGSYLAMAENRMALATRLLGATEAYSGRYQLERTPKERAMREKGIASVRAALGEETFSAAWEDGRKLSLEQALEEVASS